MFRGICEFVPFSETDGLTLRDTCEFVASPKLLSLDSFDAETGFVRTVHITVFQDKATLYNIVTEIQASVQINIFCIGTGECSVQGSRYTDDTFIVASPEQVD